MATSNEIVIHHKIGLHARPAALFVKTAAQFSSRITLENLSRGTQPVNARSILSILSAGIKKDEHIRITAEGTDEVAAINALTELIANNFGDAEN